MRTNAHVRRGHSRLTHEQSACDHTAEHTPGRGETVGEGERDGWGGRTFTRSCACVHARTWVYTLGFAQMRLGTVDYSK